MANYTISQALEIKDINAEIKQYLNTLSNSKLPAAKDKIFKAANKTELKTVLESAYNDYMTNRKERAALGQCIAVIKDLTKGTQKNKRIIKPTELLPKLIELSDKLRVENQTKKIEKVIESSGLTREQIIEYLQKK